MKTFKIKVIEWPEETDILTIRNILKKFIFPIIPRRPRVIYIPRPSSRDLEKLDKMGFKLEIIV